MQVGADHDYLPLFELGCAGASRTSPAMVEAEGSGSSTGVHQWVRERQKKSNANGENQMNWGEPSHIVSGQWPRVGGNPPSENEKKRQAGRQN